MKSIIILILMVQQPLLAWSEGDDQMTGNKKDWYTYFDQRIHDLETRLITDMKTVQQQQVELSEIMHRLNDKLENRFDKYFLWGYGTLLVIISTLVSVIFNKRKSAEASGNKEYIKE